MFLTLLACAPAAPLFAVQDLELSVPESATLLMGIEQPVLDQDSSLGPLALALDTALMDAQVEPSPAPLMLVCQSKGCYLRLWGQVQSWEREDALPSGLGRLTWSVGPGHKRQLTQEDAGALLLGDRSALQHTRERVPLLGPGAGQELVPVGPLWVLLLEPEQALADIDRRLSRSPGRDARRLRVALQPLPALLAGLQVELRELGLALTPSREGLRLEARFLCADAEQAQRLARALRYRVLEQRRGRSAQSSAALARLPVRQHRALVDVQVADLHQLLPEL